MKRSDWRRRLIVRRLVKTRYGTILLILLRILSIYLPLYLFIYLFCVLIVGEPWNMNEWDHKRYDDTYILGTMAIALLFGLIQGCYIGWKDFDERKDNLR